MERENKERLQKNWKNEVLHAHKLFVYHQTVHAVEKLEVCFWPLYSWVLLGYKFSWLVFYQYCAIFGYQQLRRTKNNLLLLLLLY